MKNCGVRGVAGECGSVAVETESREWRSSKEWEGEAGGVRDPEEVLVVGEEERRREERVEWCLTRDVVEPLGARENAWGWARSYWTARGR